jgi:hypothetical protein
MIFHDHSIFSWVSEAIESGHSNGEGRHYPIKGRNLILDVSEKR